MSQNASDVLVSTIQQWGIDTIFGLPGDGINGVIEALRKQREHIRFIQVRHEESAAFMATGYAKYTGRIGCCLATTGPGAIHLLNGLYDAKLDQAPVLAITGETYSDLRGSSFQQEVDTVALFQDVAIYNQLLTNPSQVEMLANEACRHALSHRSVAHITLPIDYQEAEVRHNGSVHFVTHSTTNDWSRPIVSPQAEDLRDAARVLNAGRRVMILVGSGARMAGREVEQVAERLAAPISKALLGKDVISDNHPHCLGGVGLLGTSPSQIGLEKCDTLLMVGTSFPYTEFLPKHDQARGVQIDDKPERIGLRYPVEVGLAGDAKATLAALLPLLEQNPDTKFLEEMQAEMRDWRQLLSDRARHERPIKPQQIAHDLNEVASDDAIISTDSGTITSWVARHFDIRGDRQFSCSGNLATMAPGLPYAIAAQIAFPDRQSIAFVGDGGFTMLMGDFATAVKYELPILVVIVKNNSLGQIKWEQIVFLGNPEYACDLHPIDFAQFARACGGLGFTVEDPEDVRDALETALESKRPAIVEVLVDPFEPPMPSRVTSKQAEHFAKALVRGEPNGGKIALTLFRDKLSELL